MWLNMEVFSVCLLDNLRAVIDLKIRSVLLLLLV